ncbi:methionyl-tRNA formyltransferase [Marinobacterium arenosum]|uniref:methionyl-tRNA formyltransferase n=1 Tax=Marinobacterium arenosum TaxID=2862496 RepID=UPI001C9824F5|nr:formyltransferase family protein [Marinobacterium arenosum]MBY4678829.1 hypothetical protein [Marinobacterium arenosum]
MNELKITVLTSGGTGLPLASLLAQRQQLAGVLLLGQWDQEKQMMDSQLKQAGIPVQYCLPGDADGIITALTAWQSELGLVFCCGEKIPMTAANTPKYGMINLHGSALPEYRGPDPIYWQVRNGETHSMLTAHRLEEMFDTGAILAQQPFDIGPYDTPNRVFSNLLQQLPAMLDSLLSQLEQTDQLKGQPQAAEALHTAPRVAEQDLLINWREVSATALCNQVRAGNPLHGGARLVMGQGQAQLLQASPASQPAYGVTPGTIIHLSPEQGLIVALKEESVRLDIIANNDGVFDGYRFAHTCLLSAGMRFQ